MSLSQLHEIWPIQDEYTLRDSSGGNNLTQLVETPSGNYYIRVYRNHTDPARVRFELDVLLGLAEAGLPFDVPAPVQTRSGEVLARLRDGALAVLVPAIPGETAARGNVAHAEVSGEALGELTQALARYKPPTLEGNIPPYGDLANVHPLVPDPLAVPAELPVPAEQQARLARLFADLTDEVPRLYRTLPQQAIHGDFTRLNTLLAGEQVSGVLDFEFTCLDLRAMDLAIGLGAWPAGVWNTGDEWGMIEAFGRGYVSRVDLLPEEAEALPLLMRLRRGATLLHYTGRFRQGLESESAILEMVEWTLLMESWAAENGAEVIRRAKSWIRASNF